MLNSLSNAYNTYGYSYPNSTIQMPVGNNSGTSSQNTGEPASSSISTVNKSGTVKECQTCRMRKYSDVSDDPGVSFKTPTHISPNASASAVSSHENEHVNREKAKAADENLDVVAQSVTISTGACPECGRTYVSGGETRTITRAKNDPQPGVGQILDTYS